MSDEFVLPAVIVRFCKKFKAIRVINDKMYPVVIRMKADLLYDSDDESDLEASIALAKMKHWTDEYLDNTVLFSAHNEWAWYTFFDDTDNITTSSNLMMFPSEQPTDDMLAQLISRKLHAIADGPISVGPVEIETEDSFLNFIYTSEVSFDLPEMEDWVGEHAFTNEPWWDRKDASTFDLFPEDDDDITENPYERYDLSMIGVKARQAEGQSATILRPKFKPTVIPGGKE